MIIKLIDLSNNSVSMQNIDIASSIAHQYSQRGIIINNYSRNLMTSYVIWRLVSGSKESTVLVTTDKSDVTL